VRSVNLDVGAHVVTTGHFIVSAVILVLVLCEVTTNRAFDEVGTLDDGKRPLGNHDQSNKSKELRSDVIDVFCASAELRDFGFGDGFGELLAVNSSAARVFADPVVDALEHLVDRCHDSRVSRIVSSAGTEPVCADSEKDDEGPNSSQEEGKEAQEISHAEKEPVEGIANELCAAGAFLHLLVPAAVEDPLRGDQRHETNKPINDENSNQGPEQSGFEPGDFFSQCSVDSFLEISTFVVHHHRANGDDSRENNGENRELPNGTQELGASAFLFRHCSFSR